MAAPAPRHPVWARVLARVLAEVPREPVGTAGWGAERGAGWHGVRLGEPCLLPLRELLRGSWLRALGGGCWLHPASAPAAARLPSPSPLSASRGCCSRLFPPPPSRCRFHGNRLGCTPVPRCAPGTCHRPRLCLPPPLPLGAPSPQNGFPWAVGNGVGVVGHPKMGAGLAWRWPHPALEESGTLLSSQRGPSHRPAMELLPSPFFQEGWHCPPCCGPGHPGTHSHAPRRVGTGKQGGRQPWLPAGLHPSPGMAWGWHGDDMGMVAAVLAGQSRWCVAGASGRTAVPAQTRLAASQCC